MLSEIPRKTSYRKTILITGATSGIGLAAAEEMAARGWHVCGVGRTQERCHQAEDTIRKLYPEADLRFFAADLSGLANVHRLADRVIEHLKEYNGGRLDVLLNNAGTVRNVYTATEDGLETQFAVNHLAGFLLTLRLSDNLRQGPAGRVLVVSSASHRHSRIHWRDVMLRRHYGCLKAYKQSKLCNVLFVEELNRRMPQNLRAYAIDPGLVDTDIGSKETYGLVSWFWRQWKRHGLSPYQAASTIVYICKMPADWVAAGHYYRNCAPCPPDRAALDPESGRKLWTLSENLCGLGTGDHRWS